MAAEHENVGELRRPQSLALPKLIAGGAKVSSSPKEVMDAV